MEGAYTTTAMGAVTVAGGLTEKAAETQDKLTRRLPSGVEMDRASTRCSVRP